MTLVLKCPSLGKLRSSGPLYRMFGNLERILQFCERAPVLGGSKRRHTRALLPTPRSRVPQWCAQGMLCCAGTGRDGKCATRRLAIGLALDGKLLTATDVVATTRPADQARPAMAANDRQPIRSTHNDRVSEAIAI
jgi:hypothetical protein